MKKTILGFVMAFICAVSVLFVGCGAKPNEYDISVLINGANFGTVEDVSGTYTENTNLTIKAKPYSGQTFFCWLHDGKVVSNKEEYSFTVSESTSGTYLALFECADLEYFYLDGFEFTNNIAAYDGDIEQNLTQISLYFGYSPNEMYEVLTLKDETLPTVQGSFYDYATLYPEKSFPFAFDKTKNVYIKIVAKYTKPIDEIEIEYISETEFVLPQKQIGVGEEFQVKDILDASLNLTTNQQTGLSLESLNQNLEYDKNIVSMNFKPLTEFAFNIEEPVE